MTRNFGRPRCIGATTPGAPSSRAAVSRESILDSSSTVERFAVNEDAAGSSPAYPAKFQLAGSSRPANSRGASPEPFIPELAAAFFGAAFLSGIAVCIWFLSILIDWSGVLEAFDLG